MAKQALTTSADTSKARAQIKFSPNTQAHEYQDKKYGKNMRVCNPAKASSSGVQWRDTVTGKII